MRAYLLNGIRVSLLDYPRERQELQLRWDEKKLQRQVDVIRAALNELGCEELPLGYDLTMETPFVESPAISKVIRIAQHMLRELCTTRDIICVSFSCTSALNGF